MKVTDSAKSNHKIVTENALATSQQLQADISYLNRELEQQVKQLQESLLNKPGISTEGISWVLSHLAQLYSQIKVIQRVLANCSVDLALRPPMLQAGSTLHADEFIGVQNLLPLEQNLAGMVYRWSGAQRCTTFNLGLERSQAVELKIGIIALMRPAFAKQMKIVIDGQTLPHKFKKQGNCFIASVKLPVSGRVETELRILLPETLSPADIGSGKETGKMGLAISFIAVQAAVTGIKRLFS